MILTDLFESPEIHNQDRLDDVLGRCIELIHEKNAANPKKYGRVAACIIDMKNRKVFGINSPGPNGTRRHAERMAIDAYHKRYGKILPGAIIVTTLSPCNRDMVERDGVSCQDLLLQVGIEKVYSGYMDPSQHSEHPFTEEVTKNDDLWRRCKEFSDSFVHDDLTESQHNTMAADQVLDYVKRTHAPDEFDIEYSITDHPEWEFKTIPLSQLNLDPDGEATDPYNRVNWVDGDKVQELIPRIGSVLKSRPIVVDPEGWIIDGNHRAVAAAEAGMTSVPALVPVKQVVAEGLEQTPDQVRQTLNAWMNRDQKYKDPSKRAGFQAQVWPYIQQNIKTILADKGEKGNGDYPAAPYAAWLLVQHMDAYPQNQIEFYNALKQAIPNHPKIQFLRDRAAVNQWIMKNANNPEYFIKGEALPNPTVNVRNPARFRDAGIVATSREEALANAEQAGNKLLVAAVNATNAQTQPSYKQSANENFADGQNPGRKGLAKRSGVNTKASVSSLRKTAKHSTGEKQRMAHWLANMKAGRAKARKK